MKDRRNRILAILEYLEREVMTSVTPVEGVMIADYRYDLKETISEEGLEWHDFRRDGTWGGHDKHYMFKADVTATEEGKPFAVTVATGDTDLWNTDNPQILMYLNGNLRATMDMNHTMAVLTESAKKGESFHLSFYAYSNHSEAVNLFRIDTAVPDAAVMSLYFDMKNIFEAADLLDENDEERIIAFKVLEDAIDVLDTRNHELLHKSAYDASSIIDEYLASRHPSVPTVWSVGSTHIDVAWKWPVRQTREKAVRSVLTALNLLDHYPDAKFLLTQPQLYQFVKELAPSLFERIKKKVADGQWEAEGGMYVESDSVLTSGESLVRQIIHGTRFFHDELGVDHQEVLWLPDAFGFNGNIPQIMKKSGLKYFMTTKINWSDTHRFPFDVFTWRGIDGSEVLAHFISTKRYDKTGLSKVFNTTYNGLQNPSQIMGTWQRFIDKDVTNDVLTCFGYGDGGGGITYQMLENTDRMRSSIARCPKTEYTTAREYFHRLESTLDSTRLPRWEGELYFEYHRGILTSVCEEKRWNRKIEALTHSAEFLAAFAGGEYPAAEFDWIWKKMLLNQFHDILPGSAIAEVYEIAFKEYEEAAAKDRKIIDTAVSAIAGNGGSRTAVFTSTSEPSDTVYISDSPLAGMEGEATYDGRYAYLLKDLPSYGVKTYSGDSKGCGKVVEGEFPVFDTPYYHVSLDVNGNIISLFDKNADREIIQYERAGNELIAYEDRPLEYDNWNLEEYYRDKPYLWTEGKAELVENNSIRAVVRTRRTFMSSSVEQDMVFYAHTSRIDFFTKIDWHEDHLLLKAEFPVDIHAGKASYEVQFGAIERSTTENTSWDRASFEVPAQRWADYSEPGFGCSIITDSRYGFSVKNGVMTLSLLKSGTYPDTRADHGYHETLYSFYPHSGTWREGGTVREAEAINRDIFVTSTDKDLSSSFVSCDDSGVIIDTVKRSEDGSGIIVRLYEAYGMRKKCNLSFGKAWRIYETDLLENEKFLIDEGDSVSLLVHPYEIMTLFLEEQK